MDVVMLSRLQFAAATMFHLQQAFFKAWFASAATIASCTFFGVIGLFYNLFPSSVDAEFSLTAFNASLSPLTRKIMLISRIERVSLPVDAADPLTFVN